MKSPHLLKIILLALPAILLVYVFLIRDRLSSGSGIGGGSYDLTKMYTLFVAGLYLLILNVAFLVLDARGNRVLLLVGILLLTWTIIMAVRNF